MIVRTVTPCGEMLTNPKRAPDTNYLPGFVGTSMRRPTYHSPSRQYSSVNGRRMANLSGRLASDSIHHPGSILAPSRARHNLIERPETHVHTDRGPANGRLVTQPTRTSTRAFWVRQDSPTLASIFASSPRAKDHVMAAFGQRAAK